MNAATIDALVYKYGLISDQVDVRELTVLLRELVRTLEVPIDGAIVEFGCYRGTTSLYVRRVLDVLGRDREFHVYDSFEGLPAKAAQDSSPAGLQFVEGELSVSKKDFLNEFKKANLRAPRIHKGWFSDLTDADVPGPIAFAFLDGDYYESIRDSLKLVEASLTPGATIIVDDYSNEALPGAARALDEWARPRGLSIQTIASLGIIHL